MNEWVIEETRDEYLKFLESNKNKNSVYYDFCDSIN